MNEQQIIRVRLLMMLMILKGLHDTYDSIISKMTDRKMQLQTSFDAAIMLKIISDDVEIYMKNFEVKYSNDVKIIEQIYELYDALYNKMIEFEGKLN